MGLGLGHPDATPVEVLSAYLGSETTARMCCDDLGLPHDITVARLEHIVRLEVTGE